MLQTTEETYAPAGGVGRTLALTGAVFLAAGVVLAGLGPALPRLAAHVGHDVAALGGLFTAISAGVVAAQFGAGPAGDRRGQRLVLVVGVLLMGVGTLGVSFSRSLPLLLVGGLLAGVGFGGVLAAGNVLVARLVPGRSAAALNAVNLFFGLGAMLGPAIASLAGARLGVPQAALWAGAGLLLALAPAVLRLAAAPPPLQATPASNRPAERPLALWLIGLLLLFYTGVEVGFGGWVTLYMTVSAGLAPASAALVATAFWFALTIGRAVGAALGLRLAAGRLLSLSLLGFLGGAALLLASVGQLERSIAGVLLLGLSCGPIFPTALALAATSARSGAPVGLVLVLGNCGGLIIPTLLGLLLRFYGPLAMAGMVLAAGVALVSLGAAVTLALAPPARNKQLGQLRPPG